MKRPPDIGTRIARLTREDPDVGALFEGLAGELEGELSRCTSLPKEKRMARFSPLGSGPRAARPEPHDASVTLINQPQTRPSKPNGDDEEKLVTAFDSTSADAVYARRSAQVDAWRQA